WPTWPWVVVVVVVGAAPRPRSCREEHVLRHHLHGVSAAGAVRSHACSCVRTQVNTCKDTGAGDHPQSGPQQEVRRLLPPCLASTPPCCANPPWEGPDHVPMNTCCLLTLSKTCSNLT
ncbi:hypothetical protein Z043_121855, partial [Scleropages formosus]